jgi:hypothetical protein
LKYIQHCLLRRRMSVRNKGGKEPLTSNNIWRRLSSTPQQR